MRRLLLLLGLLLPMMLQAQTATPQPKIRIAEIQIQAGQSEQFLRIAGDVARLSLEREPGVLCLYPVRVAGQADTYRVIEAYRDQAAYEAHLQTSHFLDYKEKSAPLVASLKLIDTESLQPELFALIFSKATPQSTRPLEPIIALEEHFIIPSINREVAAYLTRQNGGKPITTEAQRDLMKIVLPDDAIAEVGERRLRYMDESGIGMQVLSYGAGGPQNIQDKKLALRLCRAANDSLAELIRRHPTRFSGFALLPMADPQVAATELERSVRVLGLRGAMISGSPNGQHLDAKAFRPIFAKAAELGVPVYLHPRAVPSQVAQYYAPSDRWDGVATAMFATAGYLWHVDSGIELVRLIMSGVFEEYPTLQVISGHWGELVPFFLNRLDDQQSKVLQLPRKFSDYFRTNIYVTPSGFYSEAQLRYAIETVGADRILFSTDYPFLQDREAHRFLEQAQITQTAKEQIAYENARRLLRLGEQGK